MSDMKILLGDLMYKKNLTIRQVSVLTGIPKSTLEDIISGKRSPRMDMMEKLAAGLHVRIEELYDSEYK